MIKSTIKSLSLLIAAAMSCALPTKAATKVHTIGDSTMQTYDENTTVTRGWAQYLQLFLDGVTVNNRGKAGASSKSFYREAAFWTSVKTQMQEGDYVFIQFAHNDEKNSGMDGDSVIAYYNSIGDTTSAEAYDYRGTIPSTTYRQMLKNYIDETRAMNCTPVLVGPICRLWLRNEQVTRAAQHDIGDSYSILTPSGITTDNSVPSTDNSMDYVYQMKQVAEEEGVTFLDLTTATKELYESYGATQTAEIIGNGSDGTHLGTRGATLIARLCAQLMQENGVLADNVLLSSDLSISPTDGDMGEAYTGQVLTKEFTVNGFSLTPSEGTVTIKSNTAGFTLSTDQETWSDEITLSYDSSILISKYYVRCTLAEAGEIGINLNKGD